jgi:serine phosphatase RsbU (regulator of sigma subunit)
MPYSLLTDAWKEDVKTFSDKYHVGVTWIAIVFDPIFGITDYLNISHAWQHLLLLRVGVSLVCVLAVLLWRKYKFSSKYLVFVPFILISLQNAYTYSVIDVEHFMGHSLNYMALFIGGGMFIIWEWRFSAAILVLSAIANVFFFNMNHELDVKSGLINGGLLLIVVSLFMFLLIETRRRLTIDLLKSKRALLETNKALNEQKKIVEEKNKDITDSINYAKRIQTAILPIREKLLQAFPEHFVFFKPKDIVSGDFYWFAEKENKIIITAVDCTGHGVPGAFMSMIGDSILNSIVHDREIHQPDLILNEMHVGVRQALQQEATHNQDGMDMSVVVIDKQKKVLLFAGAKNPLIYIQHGELYKIKGDIHGIGGEHFEQNFAYKLHKIPLVEPNGEPISTNFYIFSDGYQDQFGGKAGKKFMIAQMCKLFLEIQHQNMEKQHQILKDRFDAWKQESTQEQTDDVILIGVRLYFDEKI